MIDLELSEKDEKIVAQAHAQALVYRRYAKQYDRVYDYQDPPEKIFVVAEEQGFPHVRDMALAAQNEADVSTISILNALILLEETWGQKIFYMRGGDADADDYFISHNLIKATGTPEQIEKWASDSDIIAWCMTEPSGGSDPATMETTARWDEHTHEWVICGEKTFISWATRANSMIVLARAFGNGLSDVVTPFMVARDESGLSVSPQMEKLGLHQWDTASVFFDNCRVPDENRLVGSLRDALQQFNDTRGFNGAKALGAAKAALDIVAEVLTAGGIEIDYTTSLAERPAILDRYIKLEELYEASWLTMMNAMWHKDNEGADQYQSLSKFVCAGACREITSACITMLGQDATSESFALEQILRDSRVYDIKGGEGNVLRLFVARWLLGYKKSQLN